MKECKERGRQGGGAREKVWAKELGCQAAVKFRMSTCPEVRINVVYALVVACGLFLVLAQLLPLRSFDTAKLWCSDDEGAAASDAFLHERINASALAAGAGGGELRVFTPHGLATHLFIEMGAYRGGPRVFSVVGLVAKPVETFHAPPYACEWQPRDRPAPTKGKATKTLPDWNYGKLYTVVVITCTFREDVGTGKEGGELILQVGYGDEYRSPERFPVLTEQPGDYNATLFTPPYPYDYVYCGSSVYGDVSPQRMREWLAYHAYFLGENSHFIFHDAGGFHPDVWTILEPWIQKGRVSVQNIRQQEIYDAYYHNQFLVVNDCLFRSRFMANWTFFFDIDEYLHVPISTSLSKILDAGPNITQITFEQVVMSTELCVADNTTAHSHARQWAFEKLVYRKVLRRGIRYDRKYVVQARHATATGVHMSMNMRKGKNLYPKGATIRYYHYHGAINQREELCTVLAPPENKTDVQQVRSQNHRIDETLALTAERVKDYERRTVGTLPFIL